MKISKKSQYGLRAMVYLARVFSKKTPTPLREISESEDIPFDFLEKIFSELEKEKLVKAKKGAGGGYFLAKDPKKITAGEIIGHLEEPAVLVGCSGCPRAGICSTEEIWEEAQESLDSALNITLAELIKPKNGKKK